MLTKFASSICGQRLALVLWDAGLDELQVQFSCHEKKQLVLANAVLSFCHAGAKQCSTMSTGSLGSCTVVLVLPCRCCHAGSVAMQRLAMPRWCINWSMPCLSQVCLQCLQFVRAMHITNWHPGSPCSQAMLHVLCVKLCQALPGTCRVF